MARKPSRNEWRQQNGLWTRSIGNRGARIRLFQTTKDGSFYRAVWLPERGISRRSLRTGDRLQAERLGKELLAALLRDEQREGPSALSLRELWERYSKESVAFLDNHPRTRADASSHAEILIGFFGEDCDVRGLTEQDQLAFKVKRLAGGIVWAGDRVTDAVRMRSVEVDLQLLNTMLRWATTVRVRGGSRLLEQHPLAGVKREREENPKRPVATWERYQQTRAKAQELASAVKPDLSDLTPEQRHAAEQRREISRRKWLKLELALVLAEATGRRLGSIRQLRWEDVDFNASTIRWRAEADKKGREWVVPVPPFFGCRASIVSAEARWRLRRAHVPDSLGPIEATLEGCFRSLAPGSRGTREAA